VNDLKKYFQNNKKNDLHKWMHYFDIYDENFSKYRNKNITILEIGVFKGGSLSMWQKYFGPKVKIIGIDINEYCKRFEQENIKIYIGDQSNINFLDNVLADIDKPDIIIDDGGHSSNQQITSFNYLYEHLNYGGTYLVEDTHTSYASSKKFHDRLDKLTFVEYAKVLSDELNDWYRINSYKIYREPVNKANVSYWAKNIYKISFYNSIIAFEKRKNTIPFATIS
tara:strand:+ start:176 stop:847 length:672 start_codon:yes stop_codon:yes gene_type:complete